MLIRFRLSNFRSFRDEAELSMVAAQVKARQDTVRLADLGIDLVRIAGIYGANGSGKSNLLAALEFLRAAVLSFHQPWRPWEPLRLEPFIPPSRSLGRGSTFEVEVLVDGIPLQYGARFEDSRVLSEWLYAFPRGRRRVWFERDAGSTPQFVFGKSLAGPNQATVSLTRKDSLFLSTAAASGHRQLLPLYRWFAEGLGFLPGLRDDGLPPLEGLDLTGGAERAMLLDLLRAADLGIVDFTLGHRDLRPSASEVRDGAALPNLLGTEGARRGHQWIDDRTDEVWFRHGSGADSYELPERSESKGTRAFFHLAVSLIRSFKRGALLCVDELSASLHPNLLREILFFVSDPARNPKGAQLLFNTHDTSLLGQVVGPPPLHRDQVWMVERDGDGVSRLYSLADFKVRKDENLERGYLQGRYGSVPFLEPALRG